MLREDVCRRIGFFEQLWQTEVTDLVVRDFRVLL